MNERYWTDEQTRTQTNTLIAILCTSPVLRAK